MMIDISIFLSMSHYISRKLILISRITTNPIRFFTDTKGNNLHLQYGSLYARDVPKYRLHHGALHSSDFRNIEWWWRWQENTWLVYCLDCISKGCSGDWIWADRNTQGKSDLSYDIVLCWNDFSCPHWVSRVRLLVCFLFFHQQRKYSHPLLPNTKKLTGWLSCLCTEDVETLGSPIAPLPPLKNQILIPNCWYWRGDFWFLAYSNIATRLRVFWRVAVLYKDAG